MYITVFIHYNDITKHYIGRVKMSPDHLMVPYPPHLTHCRHYYGRNQTFFFFKTLKTFYQIPSHCTAEVDPEWLNFHGHSFFKQHWLQKIQFFFFCFSHYHTNVKGVHIKLRLLNNWDSHLIPSRLPFFKIPFFMHSTLPRELNQEPVDKALACAPHSSLRNFSLYFWTNCMKPFTSRSFDCPVQRASEIWTQAKVYRNS